MAGVLNWSKHRLDGRAAWRLESDRLRIAMIEGGGHLALFALQGKHAPAGVNPLWKPPWKSIEPYHFSMAKDGPRYGSNSESRLLSGIRGHNVCFDYWCGPSPEETARGLSFHGEAGVVRWQFDRARVRKNELEFACHAEMPLSAARFSRTVRLRPGETVVSIEETAENLTGLDRPIGWVEHVTIGPPFLERGVTLLDLPATHGYSLPDSLGRVPSETEFEWPFLRSVDLRVAAAEERSGFNLSVLLDPSRELGFIAAATPSLGLLLAYVFRRADFPWVNVWEQNRQTTSKPWNGRALAVGLEFGNTIVPGSRQAMAGFPGEKYGVPTYGWLAARQRRTIRYLALLAEVPRDFRGAADIRTDEHGLTIVERDTKRASTCPCSSAFIRVPSPE